MILLKKLELFIYRLIKNIIIIIISFSFILNAETKHDTSYVNSPSDFSLGVKSGFNYYSPNSNFSTFEDLNHCCLYENGDGLGFNFSLMADYNLNKLFSLGIDVSYLNYNIDLVSDSDYPIRSEEFLNIRNLSIKNILKTSFQGISINPNFKWRFLEYSDSYLGLYLSPGIHIPVSNSYEQSDEIMSPDYIKFQSSNENFNVLANGEFNTLSAIQITINSGLFNQLKISEYFDFYQFLSFNYSPTNVLTDIEWNNMSIGLELGLSYYFPNKEEVINSYEVKEEVIEKPVIKSTSLEVNFVDDLSELNYESGNELLSTVPLVNHVFFETNSAEISENYIYEKDSTQTFFYGDAVEMRKYLFVRLKQVIDDNPNSRITLIGTTSGLEFEPIGIELAKMRAGSVKELLLKMGIPSNRINLNYKLLPDFPSNSDFNEGRLENQRVEIYFSNASIQEYVDFKNYMMYNGNIKINLNYKNIEPEEIFWKNSFTTDETTISKSGIFTFPIQLRVDEDRLLLTTSVKSGLLFDSDTMLLSTDLVKNINKRKSFTNFQAVLLFNYGSSDLSKENKDLIEQLIQRLDGDETIVIRGSADALGTELQNQALAHDRASTAKNFINEISDNEFKIMILNNFKKFPEDTPEGRFLNRSISIELIKP